MKIKSLRSRWKREEKRKIEYEPRTVKDILKEMKDISQLIVDLSYSSLLFHNEELAEEVKYLEARMDSLNYEIRMEAMLAARNVEDAEKMAGILQVAEAAESISNAAGDIVKIMKLKFPRPLIPSLLKESDENITRIKVEKRSKSCGKRIKELRIRSETGTKIIAIRRKEKDIYGPDKEQIIEAEDIVILKGTDEGIEKVREFLIGNVEVLK
jgi:Uncharacterized conserved protein